MNGRGSTRKATEEAPIQFPPRKACWTTYYELGVALNRVMPREHTLDEVAARFGISSRQNAYTETVLALGKLAYRARLELAEALKRREEV